MVKNALPAPMVNREIEAGKAFERKDIWREHSYRKILAF